MTGAVLAGSFTALNSRSQEIAMIQLAYLALFALLITGCGDGDGATDQQPSSTDRAATDPPKMTTYELRLQQGYVITIEAPVGMTISDGDEEYARLEDADGNSLRFTGTNSTAADCIRSIKENVNNWSGLEFLTETADTLIFMTEDDQKTNVAGFWFATLDDNKVEVEANYSQWNDPKKGSTRNSLTAVKEALGWVKKSLKIKK